MIGQKHGHTLYVFLENGHVRHEFVFISTVMLIGIVDHVKGVTLTNFYSHPGSMIIDHFVKI